MMVEMSEEGQSHRSDSFTRGRKGSGGDAKSVEDDDGSEDFGDSTNKAHRSGRIESVNLANASPVGIVKKGILSKKARAKFIRPWALRTVVLDEQFRLFYYDRDVLKGVIALTGTGVRHAKLDQSDGRPFAFEIVNINDLKSANRKASTLLLAAGSQAEADEWVEAIHSLVKKVNRSNQSTEYESFEDVTKANLANPIDIRKLKQQRKKRSEELEQEMEDEDDDEEDGDDYFSNTGSEGGSTQVTNPTEA